MNDPVENATWVYTYDRGGNILNKKKYAYTTGTVGTVQQTISYTYNSAWKDKLATYNGTTLSYDAIGNLTGDSTWTYTWAGGRQLSGMSKSGTAITYAYNNSGLRVRKTVAGVATNYTLNGKLITHLTKGSDWMHFFYDGQGKPSIVNYKGATYRYLYNLQGDVIGLIDTSGNVVVEYKYDAWGKIIGRTGSLASTLGYLNPFRYRGYVYDEETGLYYLRSRYYNPEWGRFINADVLLGKRGALLSHNLFAYCRNNPIMNADYSGKSDVNSITAGIKKVVSGVKEGVQALVNFVGKSAAYYRIKKSLSTAESFSYITESSDRTFGLFGSYRETITTTVIVIPSARIKGFIFDKWMSEHLVNVTPLEEGLGYGMDVLLEFMPESVPGLGIVLGIPDSIVSIMQAREDTQLAQCISKAMDRGTGIVVVNHTYVSSTYHQEKNTYFEFFDYLDSLP